MNLVHARLFDSILSYRHGTSAINKDTGTLQASLEPDAPDSIDDLFAYIRTSETDNKI